MTAESLLRELEARGVALTLTSSNNLKVDAPAGVVNDRLRAALKTHKQELVQLIEDREFARYQAEVRLRAAALSRRTGWPQAVAETEMLFLIGGFARWREKQWEAQAA